jgi:16S rRNA (guanine527-N7)-methyltransferase
MHVSVEVENKLHELVTVFLEENAKINLSAFRTEEACWTGNVLDSLAAADLMNGDVIDVGTGGGFPLLPLAMSHPECSFTGVDATKKKIDAVQRIADAMHMNNVTLIPARAESLGHDKHYREKYDIALARAVADLSVLFEYCSPFVKPSGHIILWKSLMIDQELLSSKHAQKELRCTLVKKIDYELPGDFGKRQLLVFEKTGPLPTTYPRPVGIAKKKPL